MNIRKSLFPAAVLSLLALIWLEVGGTDTLANLYRQAIHIANPFGKKEEPAPYREQTQEESAAAWERAVQNMKAAGVLNPDGTIKEK